MTAIIKEASGSAKMMGQLKLNFTIQFVLRKHGQYTCIVHFGSKLGDRA